MNTTPSENPSSPVYRELDQHIRAMRTLINQLEPSERLTFINEMMMRLLPSRNNRPTSAQDKLNSKQAGSNRDLNKEELQIINRIGKNTDDLFRSMQDDDLL
jgi:hypothetical protein